MNRVLEEIKPETAEMIGAQARKRGLSVDDYVRSLLPRDSLPIEEALPLHMRATPEELASAYAKWAAAHNPTTPVVLDDSRESIYED